MLWQTNKESADDTRCSENTGKRSQAVSAKKQAILSAALETFSQFGIHGTRLEQVAEQAGVSKPICSITTRPKRRFMLR
jgi:TetR/AcrR family transcriptional regulator